MDRMGFSDTYLFRTVAVLLVSAAIAALPGCKEDAGSAPSPPPPIPQVEVVTAIARTVPDEPEFIGQAEASRPVEIRPQVTGILKAVLFSEGREIKKGAKLYQIDPVPFEAAYKSAQARIAEAEARLVQAKQDLARVKPLLEEQAVSQKDVDDAIAGDLTAKAALQRAQADLIKAKFDFDNTTIVAPITGLIERSRYYEGRLVSAQTDLLTMIHRIHPMYVVINVPESFLLKRRQDAIAVGLQHPGLSQLKGTVILADGSAYAHEGVLDFADVGLRTETGSRRARFVVPNPDGMLLPGQFVKVRFKGTMKDHALLVPQRAVQQGPQGPIVFVVGDGDKVEIRPIKASSWQDQEWIIESGVKSGERIIVSGFHTVAPGAPVKPIPAATSTADGKPDNGTPVGVADPAAEAKPEASKDPQ
ncbi:RND efflux system, membrane fusion protein [Candidatus Nitrospira nitrificans]|uniref:RND efflux system, membrane fusion protein n=2 Tax=Candidatus Nitrospira nitrificans TaxID=1742973 RepID=A0A0S4L4X5_9BACT|nr:RND efflux system, membrane fusion protein [Candidatus Nitrospira nitrificans]